MARSSRPQRPKEQASEASAPTFARAEDFDSTLYFLDDREIAYLQEQIRHDFAADLKPPVLAALLDTFELESAAPVRDEICAILESFFLTLLSNFDFRGAAYLLAECAVASERSRDLAPEQRERLLAMAQRMSDGAVLSQLLDALEDTPLRPPQTDLISLLAQLSDAALRPLVEHLVTTRNVELRILLEQAVTRLAASNTAALIALIESDNEAVALEAVKRSGALRSAAAVPALSKIMSSDAVPLRRAALAALVEIGSAGAMQCVERGVDDEDRAIRVAAVTALTERQHRGALSRVERAVKDRIMRDGNSQERVAFFDAYAVLAGDAAVAFLDGVMNPRGFLSRKEDAATRAAAAMALGKIGSSNALDALRRAAADKDVVVRTAASRALRGGAA